METIPLFDMNNNEIGKIDLAQEIFNVKPNPSHIQASVRTYLSNKRQGTASTKTRSDVRGGGRKPYRQKGTGQARRGTNRSPLLVGGGIIFGPHPRSYALKLNKKVSRSALRSTLSLKQREGKVIVIDKLELSEKKTKNMVEILKKFNIKSALIVDKNNENLYYSCRNIRNIKYQEPQSINVFDLLKYNQLILTKESLKWINEASTL